MTGDHRTAYSVVTERLLAELEKGNIPWQKPWRAGAPRNVNNRRYKGINAVLLGMLPYSDPRWLTYKQSLQFAGHVKKGERGVPVLFWTWRELESEETAEKRVIPFARTYTVFNLEQCADLDVPQLAEPPRINTAEAVIEGMPYRPPIIQGGDRAFYAPKLDTVHVPGRSAFSTADGYYLVLLHELVHSTGHHSRLNREGIALFDSFGSNQYSREELIAEVGAAFLGHEVGILPEQPTNQGAYIASWLRVLQNDRRMLVQAASQAQRAADFILRRLAAETSERTNGVAA